MVCHSARPTTRSAWISVHRWDDYEGLKSDRCIMLSSEGNGKALIRMGEGSRLDIELTLYQQIEKYIGSPKASAVAASGEKDP